MSLLSALIIFSCLQQDRQGFADYFKQLVMSCLQLVCDKLTNDVTHVSGMTDKHVFNVDLIVQCIRTSDNCQTHHHALMLLTSAATLFPVKTKIDISFFLLFYKIERTYIYRITNKKLTNELE